MELDELKELIGKNLKDLRKKSFSRKHSSRRLSQDELALTLEMSPAHLRKIERGSGNPTLETLCNFANYFGVSVVYFLTEHSEEGNEGREKR